MCATRRSAVLAFVVFAVGAAAAAPTTPASASAGPDAGHRHDPGIEVSDDGTHYGGAVTTPLFTGWGRFVPGDRETATLWVRNAGELGGVLRVSGTHAWASSAEFAAAIAISAAIDGGAADAPITLGSAAECALILRGPRLEPEETVAVRITVAFSPSVTGRAAADDQAGLDFVVALRDPADPASETADCASGTVVPGVPDRPDRPGDGSGGSGRRVADTGAAIDGPLAAGALALLTGLATLGILAVRESRRRRALG
ncbi:hypothetical protein SAMN05216554_2382 [Herbiconiux ginsengi]|uniref:Gram-positive cocci surface proteins LPxTG domain-containing protein n=2 Tax=Herbiconiux ginsengi TaxID=381665 RepID=A0A1H3Q8G5_9MICO|nr:hypothetical protein SAMN05216554_2382 [Herbiconiux ginsengi]